MKAPSIHAEAGVLGRWSLVPDGRFRLAFLSVNFRISRLPASHSVWKAHLGSSSCNKLLQGQGQEMCFPRMQGASSLTPRVRDHELHHGPIQIGRKSEIIKDWKQILVPQHRGLAKCIMSNQITEYGQAIRWNNINFLEIYSWYIIV